MMFRRTLKHQAPILFPHLTSPLFFLRLPSLCSFSFFFSFFFCNCVIIVDKNRIKTKLVLLAVKAGILKLFGLKGCWNNAFSHFLSLFFFKLFSLRDNNINMILLNYFLLPHFEKATGYVLQILTVDVYFLIEYIGYRIQKRYKIGSSFVNLFVLLL